MVQVWRWKREGALSLRFGVVDMYDAEGVGV